MRIRSVLIAAALASASTVANAAELVSNGDFSAPGSAPASWTVGSGTEIRANTGSDYGPCCGVSGTVADLSNRFASFGSGNEANVSTLSQIISTVAGSHTLNFAFGALGSGSQSLTANVFDLSDNLLATLTVSANANNALGSTFSPYSLLFNANGASRISFSVDGVTNNVDGILDNVSVQSPVPEPATWALMLLGFGAVGTVARRRKVATPQFA